MKYIFLLLIFFGCSEFRVANLDDEAKLHSKTTLKDSEKARLSQIILKNANSLKHDCNNDNAKACNELGFMLFEGFELSKDIDLALKYYDKGCNLGDLNACDNIIYLYQNGYKFKNYLIKQDLKKAQEYKSIKEKHIK